jgi:hypothetical protein
LIAIRVAAAEPKRVLIDIAPTWTEPASLSHCD